MADEGRKSFYVVYVGRKPGVYTSYVECHSQIERWNGGMYRTYFSRSIAENAWEEYVNNKNNNVVWSTLHMGYICSNDVAEGRPPVTMGRYAETEYLAREDAALVTGFSGASFESFDTFEEAKVMWDNHVRRLGGAEPIRDNGPNGEGSSSGLGSEGESMAGEARVGDANESENVGCLEAFILGLLVGLAITHKQFYP
ncbi:hypothetical protein RIF29_31611 [Crotalaria pallida]|uniref:Ribonuclease H1 N-terminal domain-containing protein n=1 Tax=Crotalaria pallida TaxID=3830 RepID=A0AAN9HYX9_CROPI